MVEETRFAFQQDGRPRELVLTVESSFDTRDPLGCSIVYNGNSCALCQICPSGGYTADCYNLVPFAQINCSDSPNDLLSLLSQSGASYSPTLPPAIRNPIQSNFSSKRPSTFPSRSSPSAARAGAGSPPSAALLRGTNDCNAGVDVAVAIAVPIIVFVLLSALVAAIYLLVLKQKREIKVLQAIIGEQNLAHQQEVERLQATISSLERNQSPPGDQTAQDEDLRERAEVNLRSEQVIDQDRASEVMDRLCEESDRVKNLEAELENAKAEDTETPSVLKASDPSDDVPHATKEG